MTTPNQKEVLNVNEARPPRAEGRVVKSSSTEALADLAIRRNDKVDAYRVDGLPRCRRDD